MSEDIEQYEAEPIPDARLAEFRVKALELLRQYDTATAFKDEAKAAIEASMALVVVRLVAEVVKLRTLVRDVEPYVTAGDESTTPQAEAWFRELKARIRRERPS